MVTARSALRTDPASPISQRPWSQARVSVEVLGKGRTTGHAFPVVLMVGPAQRSESATCSRWSIASCKPPFMPELMCASRCCWFACYTRIVRVVRPSLSLKVMVFTASASGMPS